MKLLIVESPSKAKKIESFLDGEFVVRASVGHVRDLPVSENVYIDSKGHIVKGDTLKKMKKAEKQTLKKIPSIDIENDFKPYYVMDEKKAHIVKEIKDLARKSNEILLATDPDREGESIAWHIKELCDLKTAKRVTYNEITPEAVKNAIKNPREIDMNLKEAQEARRVLDRLVGYEMSDIVWKKVRYGLSAGRVQSPSLRIVVEREKEIMNFIPEKYFELTGTFKINGKIKESKSYNLLFNCDEVPKQEERANTIKIDGQKANWSIDSIKDTEVKRSPNAPFTTSSLQQTASNRLGYSPKRTMQIAQKLYEKGLITYMRTDSTNLSKDFLSEANAFVKKEYGAQYAEVNEYKTKNKNAQEAHEAVRPVHAYTKSAGGTEEEKKLYNLIWSRAISSQMQVAKIKRTKIILKSEDKNLPTFSINGSVLIFDGWLKVDIGSKGEENILPAIDIESEIKNLEINIYAKETEPPSRYTEAGLIKEIEKRGIGRPATFATIVSTIEERGYVEKLGKSLKPTATGMVVSDFLHDNFTEYVSDDFTKTMEDRLDEIATGKETYLNIMKNFYKPFHETVLSKNDIEKVTNMSMAPADILCPTCGNAMQEKLSRNGIFYSCVNFPNCSGARKLDGSVMEGPKEIGKTCPKCNEGQLVERDGRFGKFISCANYPKCKYIEKTEEDKLKNNTGIKCNKCSNGYMEERRGRFGVFYSCSNYPDCKHAIKAKPTGEFCTMCNEMMMEGTKTIPNRCSNKACPNHNPHKLGK